MELIIGFTILFLIGVKLIRIASLRDNSLNSKFIK